MQQYSQLSAMFAISKASLMAQFRSPSAVLFSFGFPFIFILIFGFIGDNGGVPVYRIALDKTADTSNALYRAIKASDRIRIINYHTDRELRNDLVKGKITGIFNIKKNSTEVPAYTYTLSTTSASNDKWPQFLPVVNSIVNRISDSNYKNRPAYAIPDFDYKRDA